MFKNLLFWLLIGVSLTSVFNYFDTKTQERPVDYSAFISSVKQGDIAEVSIKGNQISGIYGNGSNFINL